MFAGYNDATQVERVVNELEVWGDQQQLIVSLYGPAGACNSAAVKVTRCVRFSFCRMAKVPCDESIFMFTVYAQTVAMEVDGVTMYKAAYIFQKKALNKV